MNTTAGAIRRVGQPVAAPGTAAASGAGAAGAGGLGESALASAGSRWGLIVCS